MRLAEIEGEMQKAGAVAVRYQAVAVRYRNKVEALRSEKDALMKACNHINEDGTSAWVDSFMCGSCSLCGSYSLCGY